MILRYCLTCRIETDHAHGVCIRCKNEAEFNHKLDEANIALDEANRFEDRAINAESKLQKVQSHVDCLARLFPA